MGLVGLGHLVQRPDGQLTTGSTEEEGQGVDTYPTPEARLGLMEQAVSMMPCVEVAEVVQQLAGPRPVSQDELPLMGPVPVLSGVYLNTGHGHSGILLAAVAGRHVAELVARGSSSVLAETPYLPARFINA
jgi:glycine/D-amino acid oxidase-like deaminating enzyme